MTTSRWPALLVCLALGCPAGRLPEPAPRAAVDDDAAAARTAERVRAEFLHAWRGYKRHAWGHDALRPLSRTHHDWYREPLLMSAVDALDTMILLGLTEEAAQTRDFIARRLRFDKDLDVRAFEITIRLLGGLLSAYQLSGDRRLLALAEDLGRRLLPAYDSPTGMPYGLVNLRTGKVGQPVTNPAEIGTSILELGTLSRLTGDARFEQRSRRALRALYGRRSRLGLVGQGIDVRSGRWTDPTSHVGGAIDSYYEYLYKCALLFDDRECARMWQQSIAAVNRHLADESAAGLWYRRVDMDSGRTVATRFGALEAFLPGLLALSGDLRRGAALQRSCLRMWQLAGVEPEEIDYRSMTIVEPRYVLRPEIIESAYYLFQLTRDARYRQMGLHFLEGLVRHCRTEAGYAALADVRTKRQADEMESFFFAETLKYLYLLFAPPQRIDLRQVVFNTEAHPLRKVPPRVEGR